MPRPDPAGVAPGALPGPALGPALAEVVDALGLQPTPAQSAALLAYLALPRTPTDVRRWGLR